MAALLSTQTRTSGGSSDTDVNAFAVMPQGVPRPAATTVTPVANRPRTDRSAVLAETASLWVDTLTPCPRCQQRTPAAVPGSRNPPGHVAADPAPGPGRCCCCHLSCTRSAAYPGRRA